MYWTTEQVAEFLEITVEQVYESRRRKEYPGIIGTNRGRRLMFDAEKVQAGPEVAQTTNDPLEALLWTAQGIEAKLANAIVELQQIRTRLTAPAAASLDEVLAMFGVTPEELEEEE